MIFKPTYIPKKSEPFNCPSEKSCARYIKNLFIDAHTCPLFKNLEIKKLQN